MADNESFLELEELDPSSISAFIKLQAFVRGFLVRKWLNDIRQDYEDIFKDVDDDSECTWPNRFAAPTVRTCSKRKKSGKYQERKAQAVSDDGKQDLTTASLKPISQSKPDNDSATFDLSHENESNIFFNSNVDVDHFQNCNERDGFVIDNNKREIGDDRNPLPSTFPAHNSRFVSRVSCKDQNTSIDNAEPIQSQHVVGIEFFSDKVNVEQGNPNNSVALHKGDNEHNNNKDCFVTRSGSSLSGIQNANDTEHLKSVSVTDQGIQIDLGSYSLVDGEVANGLLNVGLVSKEVQVDQSEIAAVCVSENSKGNTFDGDRTDHSRNKNDRNCVINDKERHYSSDLDSADWDLNAKNFTGGMESGGNNGSPVELKSCDITDEVFPVSKPIEDIHNIPKPSQVSPVLSKTKDDGTYVKSVDDENQMIGSDGKSLTPNGQTPLTTPVGEMIDVKDDRTGSEVKDNRSSQLSDLPSDKESLLELKKTMTMELLWIQQAINSRKHYLRLKQNLVP